MSHMNSEQVSAGGELSRSSSRVGNLLLVLCSFLLATFSLFNGLGRIPLMDPDEGRNASVAREMMTANEWLVPRYNGTVYLDKPAFFFDASALAMRIFGASAGTARLPSAVSAAALLLAVFLFCRRERGTRMAALAVVIVATLPLYAIFARLVIFDMMLALFVSLAILAGYLAERTHGVSRRMWYVLGSISAGAATLVKGPIGFVLPLLVLLVFNPLDGRRGAWKRMLSPLNLLVFNAIVLPWFLGLSHVCPDFPRYGLIEETFHRFTTGQFRRRASVFFFVPVLVGGLLMWNLILPAGGWQAWRTRRNWSSLVRLCIVWSVTVVCFFSIPRSKMPAYILTASVSFGILVAAVFEAAWRNPASRSVQIVIHAVRALGLLSFAAALSILMGLFTPTVLHPNLEAILGESSALRPLFMATAAGLFLISALSYVVQRKANILLAVILFVTFQLVVRTVALASMTVLGENRSSHPLASALAALPPETEVASYGTFAPGLPFYLGRAVTLVSADGKELRSNYQLFSIRNTGLWPPTIIPPSQLDTWLAGRQHPVMLVARPSELEFIEKLASRLGGKVVTPTPSYCGVLIPMTKEH